MRRPLVRSLLVMFVLGCSSASSGSSGCGSTSGTKVCKIDTIATLCGERITLECFEGATPDAKAQCEQALSQANEVVYCCTNNAGDFGGGGGGP